VSGYWKKYLGRRRFGSRPGPSAFRRRFDWNERAERFEVETTCLRCRDFKQSFFASGPTAKQEAELILDDLEEAHASVCAGH
jgi:hypothetical protein